MTGLEPAIARRQGAVAAALLGVGAVAAYAAVPNSYLRLAIAVAVVALGFGAGRIALFGSGFARVLEALLVVSGAFLVGPPLSTAFDADLTSTALLVWLPLAVAAVGYSRQFRAAMILAAIVVPLTLAAALATIAGGSTLVVVMLVVSLGCVVTAVARPAWTTPAVVSGATATALAAGSGGLLAVIAQFVTDGGDSVSGTVVVTLLLGVIAAALVVISAVRRDFAAGVASGAALVAVHYLGIYPPSVGLLLLFVVLAVVAGVAAAVPGVRQRVGEVVSRVRHGGGTTAQAMVAAGAVAAVVVFVLAPFVFSGWLFVVLAFAGLAGVCYLAARLGEHFGPMVGTAALVGIALAGQWVGTIPSTLSPLWAAIVGLIAPSAAAVYLFGRLRTPTMAGAIAFVLIHQAGELMWTALALAGSADLLGSRTEAVTPVAAVVAMVAVGRWLRALYTQSRPLIEPVVIAALVSAGWAAVPQAWLPIYGVGPMASVWVLLLLAVVVAMTWTVPPRPALVAGAVMVVVAGTQVAVRGLGESPLVSALVWLPLVAGVVLGALAARRAVNDPWDR